MLVPVTFKWNGNIVVPQPNIKIGIFNHICFQEHEVRSYLLYTYTQ